MKNGPGGSRGSAARHGALWVALGLVVWLSPAQAEEEVLPSVLEVQQGASGPSLLIDLGSRKDVRPGQALEHADVALMQSRVVAPVLDRPNGRHLLGQLEQCVQGIALTCS